VKHSDLTVLVLGVGGNVSQGILKALALSSLRCRVIGACIDPMAFGLYTVNHAFVSPRADDPNFLEWLIAICRAEGVQAILSGVEPVLTVLARWAEEVRNRTGAIVIVSDPSRMAIGDDKLLTCQWLESHGFNFPRYAPSEDKLALEKLVDGCRYPLIAKPRVGKGARGIFEVTNPVDLAYVSNLPNYIVQEYIGNSSSEYTAGCFCDRNGEVRGTLVMRRELLEGTTYRAVVGEYPEVREEAACIAAALQPLGPCNVQIRMSSDRPVCFEINVRFSGTTPLRARLGFNDVEACLRHYVLGEPASDLPVVTHGVILRYWNEMYVDRKAFNTLSKLGRLDTPHSFNTFIEDYGLQR
jgi:carbamoyl-phosphate synthase large subunit